MDYSGLWNRSWIIIKIRILVQIYGFLHRFTDSYSYSCILAQIHRFMNQNTVECTKIHRVAKPSVTSLSKYTYIIPVSFRNENIHFRWLGRNDRHVQRSRIQVDLTTVRFVDAYRRHLGQYLHLDRLAVDELDRRDNAIQHDASLLARVEHGRIDFSCTTQTETLTTREPSRKKCNNLKWITTTKSCDTFHRKGTFQSRPRVWSVLDC